MQTLFMLTESVELENKINNVHVEDINSNTYIITAPTIDIAGVIEQQLKKQSKEYTKVVTGGVLFAPYIVKGSSHKVIYFEFDGKNITTYGENGTIETLENPDRIVQVLSRIELIEPKIFFKSEIMKNVESVLGHIYSRIKFTCIPDEDTFEISAKSKQEISAIRRVLDESNIDYSEVHYGSTFNIPNVYVQSLQRSIYFTLDDNGEYMPLYAAAESDEIISENIEFLKNFII